ncbi:ATP-binding protein [Parvularcula oceani]|uniref:ATP-binding protein n=1 Tax=Parvularcula oceani TaxID=1247963 RepID=UPI00068AC040|nr:ATP-binding protein [Parvularcula oceani]
MKPSRLRINSIRLRNKQDVARVRQVGHAATSHLGFTPFDRTRITTAMIELARNVVSHGEGGRMALHLASHGERAELAVSVVDTGPGLSDREVAAVFSDAPVRLAKEAASNGLGLHGVRRLADRFDLRTSPNGTQIDVGFCSEKPASDLAALAQDIAADLERLGETDPVAALAQQNQELLEALRERDLLLAEVHHRTRNNLTLIASLVRLSCNAATHEETRQALADLDSRIQAVASVHQHLERGESGATLQAIPFLRSVADASQQAFSSAEQEVTIRVGGDDIALPHQAAVDIGLIVGELLTNAMKHAFPERDHGRITVTLEEQGEDGVLIEVRDDGVGLPAGKTRPENGGSLGWRMIRSMTQRYEGRLDTEAGEGLCVRIALAAVTEREIPDPRD